MMDNEKQLPGSTNLDNEIDAAITEAEAEYTTDNQLIDAREALSDLKKKHFR